MKPILNFRSAKRCIGPLMLCLLFSAAVAQTDSQPSSSKTLSGGFGYFTTGIQQNNLRELNQLLTANGYHSLSNAGSATGGGGMFVFDNFLLGGGGARLSDAHTYNSLNTVTLKGGYGYFNIGYILYSGKRSIFYPAVGVGGGSYSIDISEKNLSGSFDKHLSNPKGMTTTKSGGWIINLQLAYQVFLSKSDTKGFMLGLHAGYKLSPGWETTLNNAAVNGSPKINMNGFYAGIILGGGGLFKN